MTPSSDPGRGEQPEPFVRGCAYPAIAGISYPRADPADLPTPGSPMSAGRLPVDTCGAAMLPVGVRLELVGDAQELEVAYRTETMDLGYRGDGAGRSFAVWRGGRLVAEAAAVLGEGVARLTLGSGDPGERFTVYLPEGMRPTILGVSATDGEIEPAPLQPRWLCYGDSIAEGWISTGPSWAWPMLAAREHGLDVVNLGYAGSARGELVSAMHLAALDADVISITHGTNCWSRVPHSVGMFREGLRAFLDIVRQGHPETPIVVASPVLRPDAEATRNQLGATLADLRQAMEDVVAELIEVGDDRLTLFPGGGLLGRELLPDGIHPGDEGHRILADTIGAAVARAQEA